MGIFKWLLTKVVTHEAKEAADALIINQAEYAGQEGTLSNGDSIVPIGNGMFQITSSEGKVRILTQKELDHE